MRHQLKSNSGRRRRSAFLALAVLGLVPTLASAQNHSPDAPVILEPTADGLILNPGDVHMATAPFSDADVGDLHLCSDFEIWDVGLGQRVWFGGCVTGPNRVHSHLGNGYYENTLFERRELLPNTNYELRIRFRDNSGDAATQWSPFAVRPFTTGNSSQVYPMLLHDVLDMPAPSLRTSIGGTADLRDGLTISVESALGELLLSFTGTTGGYTYTNPPPLPDHRSVRVRILSPVDASLPALDARLYREDARRRGIYLPAVSLLAGVPQDFWVSVGGSTYVALPGQTVPDFTTLARSAPLPWDLQPGYAIDVFATDLQMPVNIAFVPNPGPNPTDPYFYVTELYGTIKLVTRNGTVSDYATGVLNFDPFGSFIGSGQQGLTGLCVEPDSGDLFITMLYASDPLDEGAPHYPIVQRFHSTDGGRTASSHTTVLDMAGETQAESHQVSNVSIGPDEKLYVHMGEGYFIEKAQDLTSFRGKILRMNLDGSPAADNPFFDASNGISATDYVWAYGLRNPFGATWRARDSGHYTVENGPNTDRFSKSIAGRNYLWDGTDASMLNDAIANWTPAAAPVNITFIQPETFNGSGFPASKHDHAFVTQAGEPWFSGPQPKGKRVTEWVLDDLGNLVLGPIDLARYEGDGKATAVALAAGPDGLYFSDFHKDANYDSPIDRGSNILRIRYTGEDDCNGNGVFDSEDIAAGTSRDINGNGVPDECEFCVSDFNRDGFVTGDDFDAFVLEFTNGDIGADTDRNGFVNGDDFDLFILRFEVGC